MTARTLLLPPLALAVALLLAAACGGGGDEAQPIGRLTDSATVPTATPQSDPPVATILGPNTLTPISPDGGEEDDGDAADVDVTPVTPFQITSADSTNLRTGPTTGSGIAGTIGAGDEETVVGLASGEAVEAGNDVWYQLEDGSFVYSGAVTNVE